MSESLIPRTEAECDPPPLPRRPPPMPSNLPPKKERPLIKPERVRDAAARFPFLGLLREDGCEFISLASGTHMSTRCPHCGSPGGQFRYNEKRRRTHCFACGQHGDVYAYLMKTRAVSFEEAFAYVDGWVGDE